MALVVLPAISTALRSSHQTGDLKDFQLFAFKISLIQMRRLTVTRASWRTSFASTMATFWFPGRRLWMYFAGNVAQLGYARRCSASCVADDDRGPNPVCGAGWRPSTLRAPRPAPR